MESHGEAHMPGTVIRGRNIKLWVMMPCILLACRDGPPEGHLGTLRWKSVWLLPDAAHQPRGLAPGDCTGGIYENSARLGGKPHCSLSRQALTLEVTSPFLEASLVWSP